ncbi:MAG: hypothetical protein A4E68_00325 [Syntrophaceae bacterium PtaB.Bin095]|jgi:hypothetical protein|nr:MAG: hypothetical protein A4E68_00325 [Syntrophaceae bacterium PtaB.Bin095]
MDIVTVLTKIVQEQQGLIMEQRKAAEEQRDINVALYYEKIARLERLLASK